jgi:hypothetical protein
LWRLVDDIAVGRNPRAAVLGAIAVAETDPPPTVAIDCKLAARRKWGLAGDSIMAQLAAAFQRIGNQGLRGRVAVMRAELSGERPGDHFPLLLEQAAASIFDPSSQLCVPCHTTPEWFVPWAPKCENVVFEGIGIFIGIVIRTGRTQRLPFAPVVWRYLAGDDVTSEAIFAIDPALKALRDGEGIGNEVLTWEVRSWGGRMEPLPGHTEDARVLDVGLYVEECVSFKANQLKLFMRPIRRGMRENLGIARHTALTADLLTELATGARPAVVC